MKFPTAHTILLIIAAGVTLLTWLIPAGKYETLAYDADRKAFLHHQADTTLMLPGTETTLEQFGIAIPLEKFTSGAIWKPVGIPGSYAPVNPKPQGLLEWIQSPLLGIIDAIDVMLLVLIIGGYIAVVQATGAFDAGIQWLSGRLAGRELLLIIAVSLLIALAGSTFGFAEETIAFYPILVPIFLAAGYDALVALATIYIGTSMGTMASTINPFSAIIASHAAGVNWTSGLPGRALMFVAGMSICLWYIIRYAERVRKSPKRSLIYAQKTRIESLFLHRTPDATPRFSTRNVLILFCFAASFVIMIAGVSLWEWWFLEMTTVFLAGALLVGLLARLPESRFVEIFVQGAGSLLGVAFIIGIARGITVIMDQGMISDSLLYKGSQLVQGMHGGVFINMMMVIFSILSFFVPSSSGLAVLSMPILAPLADVVQVPREAVVNAYMYGMGLLAFISPSGLLLPSLTLVEVGFDKWLRFVLPLLGWLTLLTVAFLTGSVYLGI